jgi:hypothetical protein
MSETKKIEVFPMRIWNLREFRKAIERKKSMELFLSNCPHTKKRLIETIRFLYGRDLRLTKIDVENYVNLGLLCENNEGKLETTDYFNRYYAKQNERIRHFIKKFPKTHNCPYDLERFDELKKWLAE